MIKFFLTRDVAAPERESGNAGFDFFVPKFNEAFKLTCAKEAEKNPKAGCYFKTDENGKDVCIGVYDGPYGMITSTINPIHAIFLSSKTFPKIFTTNIQFCKR